MNTSCTRVEVDRFTICCEMIYRLHGDTACWEAEE
jgi:hypothetical protein